MAGCGSRAAGGDARPGGAVDGPYHLTVGDMARVDVFVPDDQLDDARLVMLATEVDQVLAAPREWGAPTRRSRRWLLWVALALLVVAVIGPVLRLVAG